LDYYHEYKESNPTEFIELMVIANKIPDERKKRLSNWGVSFKEIPEDEFIDLSTVRKANEDQSQLAISYNKHERSNILAK